MQRGSWWTEAQKRSQRSQLVSAEALRWRETRCRDASCTARQSRQSWLRSAGGAVVKRVSKSESDKYQRRLALYAIA